MMTRKALRGGLSRCASAVAAIGLALPAGTAYAFQIDTGNPDLSVRWDNTIRYNLGMRAEKRDDRIADNPNSDEGDYAFDRGDLVTNRLDLLSEFDFIYKRDYGFRVSGAAWYDAAYDKGLEQSPALAAAGWESSYDRDRYSDDTKEAYIGPHGEILDAFLFGTFDVGPVPVSVRAGRHTVYWGESLFSPVLGVSYSQSGLDLRKGQANPGVEAKELFLPLAQLSTSAQLTDRLSLAAQYFFEWEAARLPEGGTYLGSADFILDGPDRLPVAPGVSLPRRSALDGDDTGDFGLAARYRSDLLDGTVGVYYRKFDEKLPWLQIAPTFYRAVYAEDTELYGLSYTTQLMGASVGAELVYRHNTAFNSANVDAASNEGARGDAYVGLLNAIYYFGQNSLWNSAVLSTELSWVHMDKVTQHEELFNGEGYGGCATDRDDNCSTKNAYGFSVAFSPAWQQVFPAADLTLPISYSRGLHGNGAVLGGGSEGTGSYSVGAQLLYRNQHQFDLKYIDYIGAVERGNGLRDRGWVAFTYKYGF